MKRKWASCSLGGRLTFDAELLLQPSGMRDEVIVHELVHLKVPNHGLVFRTLVRSCLAAKGSIHLVSKSSVTAPGILTEPPLTKASNGI